MRRPEKLVSSFDGAQDDGAQDDGAQGERTERRPEPSQKELLAVAEGLGLDVGKLKKKSKAEIAKAIAAKRKADSSEGGETGGGLDASLLT